MRNGPDSVVYRSYMSHRDHPQMNYLQINKINYNDLDAERSR